MVYIVQWEQIRFIKDFETQEVKLKLNTVRIWKVSDQFHMLLVLGMMKWGGVFFLFLFLFFKNVCYGRIHQSYLHDREAWNREKIPESKRDVGLSVELTLITFRKNIFVMTNLVHSYTHWMITWVIAIWCVC